jgi:hypothetical protein
VTKTILLLVFISGSICISLTACQSAEQTRPIDQLLIDESAFPEGWKATEPDLKHPPRAPWSGRTAMAAYIDRGFYTESGEGAASIVIRQFDRPRAAAREYRNKADVVFRDREWNAPWAVPDDLQFECSQANQCRYGCSQVLGQARCAYVAQYDVYTVVFNIQLYDTSMIEYADLLPILQDIEKRMGTVSSQ